MGSFDECHRSFGEREAGLGECQRGPGERQSCVDRERQGGAG